MEAALAARKAAVQGLASMVADPAELWQTAVQLMRTYTSLPGEVPLLCPCRMIEKNMQAFHPLPQHTAARADGLASRATAARRKHMAWQSTTQHATSQLHLH